MRGILYGAAGVLAAALVPVAGGTLVATMGLVPVAADEPPSGLESRVAQFVLRRSIARRAANVEVAPKAVDVTSGAEIYDDLCARSHGTAANPSPLAAALRPPAPRLSAHDSRWNERELFWIVKHGIRNTAMPGWSGVLSDDDIRSVIAFLR